MALGLYHHYFLPGLDGTYDTWTVWVAAILPLIPDVTTPRHFAAYWRSIPVWRFTYLLRCALHCRPRIANMAVPRLFTAIPLLPPTGYDHAMRFRC